MDAPLGPSFQHTRPASHTLLGLGYNLAIPLAGHTLTTHYLTTHFKGSRPPPSYYPPSHLLVISLKNVKNESRAYNIADSTMEAKYVAVCEVAKEVV